MLTIIHGTDTSLSRTYFLEEKQKVKDPVLIDSDSINITDLTQIFEGGSLFGETKYVFIEQLLSKRKKSAELTTILTYLEKNADEHTILFWEGKELEKSSLNMFKKPVIKNFKLPQTVFQLLDAIKPGNGIMLVTLFHKTLVTTEPDMIFYMLIKQLRMLLACKPDSDSNTNANTAVYDPIDDIKKMQPWQKQKITQQAKLFTKTSLLDVYNNLFRLEIGIKTGTLTVPLSSAIDFLLMEV